MVLGLFEGDLDLVLNGSNFSPGQKITGTIRLKLNQPKKARELRVEFYGEIRRHSGRHSHTERIFQVRSVLSGEKIYNRGETFPFEIAVPAGIDYKVPEGIIGSLFSIMVPHPVFYVHATLDAPMEIDMNRRVMVNISGGMLNVQQVAGPLSAGQALDMARQNSLASAGLPQKPTEPEA